MNKENDKGLDDLFKKKLEDPVDQISYKEDDWDALEQMLNKHKKRKGIVYWLPVLSSVAALLLLFLGWWSFRPKDVRHNAQNNQQAVNHHQANTGINGGPKRQPAVHIPNKMPLPANYDVDLKTRKRSSDSKSLFSISAVGARHTAGSGKTEIKDTIINKLNEPLFAKNPVLVFEQEQFTVQPVNSIDLLKRNPGATANTLPNKKSVSKINQQRAFRPQFALTVMAAPDINGVGSFNQSKVGTNVGLQFSADVSKKLTITTGAVYSVKPYITGFENYHTPYQFPVTPSNVTADCRMLDIPINVGYQLYNKQQNRISIGTGLSSYIMLHESYKFNYANSYITGPTNYTVPNSNKYFFGVLNLNATYQRQLNSKVGITLQPYLKLPLSNIGYSQVRLQTTGVAVGLSWNLNSLSKP
jgi:hypothetical protein